MIRVTCTCGKQLAFQLRDAGKKGACPACQRLFLIGEDPIDVADYDPKAEPPPQRVPVSKPSPVKSKPGRKHKK
jgi:hypothetical protein